VSQRAKSATASKAQTANAPSTTTPPTQAAPFTPRAAENDGPPQPGGEPSEPRQQFPDDDQLIAAARSVTQLGACLSNGDFGVDVGAEV